MVEPVSLFTLLGILGVTLIGKAVYTGHQYLTAQASDNTFRADLEGRLICFQNGSQHKRPLRKVDLELWSSYNSTVTDGKLISSTTTNLSGHFQMLGEIELENSAKLFTRLIISCSQDKDAPLYPCMDRLRMIADLPRFRDISCGNPNCSYVITSEILNIAPTETVHYNMANFDLTASNIESVKVKCPKGEKPKFWDKKQDSMDGFVPLKPDFEFSP